MSWGRTIVRSANLAAQEMTEGRVASKALRGAAARGVCRHNLNGCLTSSSAVPARLFGGEESALCAGSLRH